MNRITNHDDHIPASQCDLRDVNATCAKRARPARSEHDLREASTTCAKRARPARSEHDTVIDENIQGEHRSDPGESGVGRPAAAAVSTIGAAAGAAIGAAIGAAAGEAIG